MGWADIIYFGSNRNAGFFYLVFMIIKTAIKYLNFISSPLTGED